MPSTKSFVAVTKRPLSNQLGARRHQQEMMNTANAPASAKKPPTVSWPQPVRSYVQRAFQDEHQIPGIERGDIEAKLKQTITQANDRGELATVDWDHLPLPQQMIQYERSDLVGLPGPPAPVWQPEPTRSELMHPDRVQLIDGGSSTSKKRKSSDLHGGSLEDRVSQAPPWRPTNHRDALEDPVVSLTPAFRSRLSVSPTRNSGATSRPEVSKSYHHSSKRQRRNGGAGWGEGNRYANMRSQHDEVPPAMPTGPVVGRSQVLEKKYFRLTAPPNPDQVRPLPVLRLALDHLKRKWKDENNYAYICDQFKSLRQDLTVQHIKNDFTVHVYENHARIALEKGDLGEYNQCQTQLRALYTQTGAGHPMEFKAYRILYFIYTCNRTDMNDLLAGLGVAERQDPAVRHALNVRSALALGNYHRFFRLYMDTPNMGAYLMDMFVERERLSALANICRAYKPTVRLRFLSEELGFESDHESLKFLMDHHAQHLLEAREDGYRLLTRQVGNLFADLKRQAFSRVDIKGQL
ncbi:MAG: Leukocyte receptor cluster (LRC) member 8 [Watsoniomyces obsoletus]|nr:MAG: Leukocyte receptor cluster (LRC) member 8 [Watsoniomyces obsoletus]